MAGHDAGVGASGGGVELSLRLGSPAAAPAGGKKKNLTVVYGRQVLCAVDEVELQAMAIISMASRETAAGKKGINADDMDQDGAAMDDHRREGTAIVGGGEQAGLSMKRSLQRFLEKRKARAAAAAGSPYAVHRPAARS